MVLPKPFTIKTLVFFLFFIDYIIGSWRYLLAEESCEHMIFLCPIILPQLVYHRININANWSTKKFDIFLI